MNYTTRTLETYFLKANSHFPALLVTGPRQIGKTTFLRHLSTPDRSYVSLDDPSVRELAQNDPVLFFQRFKPPVLLDELQYAPGLLPVIKMLVDSDARPGAFWFTGSQQFHLMKGISESLAGRVGILQLNGFSRRELLGHSEAMPFLPTEKYLEERDNSPRFDLADLYAAIWRGSYPALYRTNAPDRDLFMSSYLQTYLQRDIHDLANVGNEMSFLRFLRTVAARTGQLLNFADIGRDADISQITVKTWLSILVASGLVYLLEPWHSNLTKRLVKTPKLYFLDTGLASYLTGWTSPLTLESGAMSGAILETWVVSEILKSYRHNGLEAPLFFWRNKDLKEIDLLIHRDGTLYPVEIKKSSNPGRDALRHFSCLDAASVKRGNGAVICLSGLRLPLTELDQMIPVRML